MIYDQEMLSRVKAKTQHEIEERLIDLLALPAQDGSESQADISNGRQVPAVWRLLNMVRCVGKVYRGGTERDLSGAHGFIRLRQIDLVQLDLVMW